MGVDMTLEQVEVAQKYVQYHTQKFGYEAPNVRFVEGFIEDLRAAGLQDDWFDVIVSNCVVNLSPDKAAVLREAHRVLKPGGELYFSDVYSDTRLGDEVRKNKVLWGECVAGALHWQDFNQLSREAGFSRPYIVSVSPIPIDREDFKAVLGDAKFCAVTYRLFKVPAGAVKYAACKVLYKGEMQGFEDSFDFDHLTRLPAAGVSCVSGDRVTCLKHSRFQEEVEFPPDMKEAEEEERGEENPFSVLEKRREEGKEVKSACCGPSKCC